MHPRALVAVALLVLAQASSERIKEEAEFEGRVAPPPSQIAPPRDGHWAPPPGESGASRHAPRPGPGGLPSDDEDDVKRLRLGEGDGG